MKLNNYHARQPRIAQLLCQRHADRENRAPCSIRIDPMLDSRPDAREYGHAQATRQDRLKRQRRAQRRFKEVINYTRYAQWVADRETEQNDLLEGLGW